jgi:hypothetical protein
MRDANAQDTAKLALDMDTTNGNGPCDPIDDTRSVNVGDTYEIAVCLTDAPAAPASFGIEVFYDNTLDQCVPVDCAGNVKCVDGNPDANAGTTSWTTPDLGPDCDCSIGGLLPPQCDRNPDGTGPGKGDAFIDCDCLNPPLPAGEGVTAPVVMIKYEATEKGTGTFSFGTVALYTELGDNILRCPGEDCSGGTAETLASVPTTPTVEGTAPAGTTPEGAVPTENPNAGPIATAAAATAVAQGTPIAAINQAATATSAAVATKAAAASKTPTGKATAKPGAANQQSNGGSSGPNPILIAGIAVVAAIVVGGAGWFGYRRFRSTR